MYHPSVITLICKPTANLTLEKKTYISFNLRVAICRGLEMLWWVLDAVEELLEVVVPHWNNQHLSSCPPKLLLLSEPLSWSTSLPLGRPLGLTSLFLGKPLWKASLVVCLSLGTPLWLLEYLLEHFSLPWKTSWVDLLEDLTG